MDLATIRTAEGTTAAVRSGDRWLPLGAPDLSALLADPSWRTTAEAALASSGPDAGVAQADAELALPLPAPAKVICCGLNYADHITEMGRDLPEHPTLFAKFADTLTGPTDEIAVPPAAQGALDWEAELAVVIGTELRGAGEDEARAGIPATRSRMTSPSATGRSAPCSGSRARRGTRRTPSARSSSQQTQSIPRTASISRVRSTGSAARPATPRPSSSAPRPSWPTSPSSPCSAPAMSS